MASKTERAVVNAAGLVQGIVLRLPLRAAPAAGAARRADPARPRLPGRFWLYAAFAVCYGICETMNGNWSQLDMTSRLHASDTQASLALACFWAMVTVGRLLFGAIERRLPERVTYHLLPFVLVGTFILIGVLSGPHAVAGIAAFGVGPLKHAGVSLPAIFGFTAVIAAAMAPLSFVITRRRPAPVEPAAGSAVPMPRSSRDHVAGSSDRSGARRFQ